jgi:preprotein translocase subunit YajC
MMMFSLLAMAPPAGTEDDPRAAMMRSVVLIGGMCVMFYLLLIRPQSKQRKEQENLLKNVKTGDRILMTNGIFGIIANVKEKSFIIKIADNVKIEVLKSAVTSVVQKGDDASASASN